MKTSKYTKTISLLIFAVLLAVTLLSACSGKLPEAQVVVVAEGLINPIGLAGLPDGSLLIAEEGTGEDDLSAGISLLTPQRVLGRVISGLPSSRDSGDLSGVPFVAVSPDGNEIFTSHFALGHLLKIEAAGLPEPGQPLEIDDLQPAMLPLNNVRLVNPFDLTFSPDGRPVVSDASENGVAIENAEGTTTFFHRFSDLVNPEDEDLQIDPVPTGIAAIDGEYYVTLTGGCPYPSGSGQLVAIDTERNQRLITAGLNMPIDVAQGPDGTIWVLEFARFDQDASCFSGEGYLPESGRLSRLRTDGSLEVVLDGLNFPGAVLPTPDGGLYISEVFAGRILKIVFGESSDQEMAADGPATPLPTPQRAAIPGGPHFVNVAGDVGLAFQHGAFRTEISMDPVAMMGGGLCWLDYDNDGWLDLYLVNSHALEETAFWAERGGLPRNALYRNQGGQFEEVGSSSGTDLALRGNGCVAADFNMDGWMDIFITADGPNALLWNQGDGTFQEGALQAGLTDVEWSSAAVVGDVNADGWPDLFVGSYINLENKIPNPTGAFPQDFYGLPDLLYINQGLDAEGRRTTFREVAGEAGLKYEGRALGALFSDLDSDGDLDLYVSNDGQPNRLYINEPWTGGAQTDPLGIGVRFLDMTDIGDVGDSGSGMGVAGGDYDGDGLLDLFVTNWEDEVNALYQNQSGSVDTPEFVYRTYHIGISRMGNQMTGWGACWLDYDHDTDLDLMVVHGFVPISDLTADAQLVRLYRNRSWHPDGSQGENAMFFDWTETAGLKAVGPFLARGSAMADFDNDGDLDLAINTIGGHAALLQNQGPAGNWLQVDLGGFYPGARVFLTLPDGRVLMRESFAGSSYLASEDYRLHFGLGAHESVPQILIVLPNGEQFQVADVPANQVIRLDQAP